jgi:hypothetical protein
MFVLAASSIALAASRLPLHQAGPQPAHTGGFGEPTCHACHFDYPLNDEPRASIALAGLPEKLEPRQTYTLQLSIEHAELRRGGFQLSARFADGSAAGMFLVADSSHVRVQQHNGIGYLSHTATSADAVDSHTISWNIAWIAPSEVRPVSFHVAVNVANSDASEFGDRIFSASFAVSPLERGD